MSSHAPSLSPVDLSRVFDLAAEYHAAVASGRTPELNEVCRHHPHLLPRVRAVLQAGDQMAKVAQGEEPAPLSAGGPVSLPDRYQLGVKVGEGGMGVVYAGRDTSLDRDIAVKLLHPDRPATPDAVRRFVEEAKVTAQLQHPGIPAVHELGVLADGRPFLAMKLIQGQTLAALLASGGREAAVRGEQGADAPRSPGRWLGVFEQVCQAVGAAHAAGVIHRDLKPANVMVGAFGEVQVMDWGLAKVLTSRERERPETARSPVAHAPGSSATEDTVPVARPPDTDDGTAAGTVMGTPSYMAPEQARGEVADRRADVFALGAILCELLTGKPPLSGRAADIIATAGAGQFADAHARLDGCGEDPALVALAKRCLSVNPAARPMDAHEVAVAVASFRSESEARAKRAEVEKAEVTVQAAEQRKRRRVQAWLGGIAGGFLLTAVVGTTIGLVLAELRRVEADYARGQEKVRADEAVEARNEETKAKEAAVQARVDETKAKEAAVREKARAEKAEDETLESYRAATDDVIEKLIGSQAQLGPKEQAYLRSALDRWQAFADRIGDDERSRAIRAEGHARVGLLWQKLRRFDDAKKAYETATQLLRQLVAEKPAEPRYRADLAVALGNTAALLNAQDASTKDEVERLMTEVLALRKQLAVDLPDEPKLQADLAAGHTNLGIFYRQAGRLPEAEQEYRQAVKLLTALLDRMGDSSVVLAQKARLHMNIGGLHRARGQAEDERVEYERAAEMFEKLIASGQNLPDYRDSLASIYMNLGQMYRRTGKNRQSKEFLEKGLRVQERLADDFPANVTYRIYQCSTLCSLGHLECDDGDLRKGLERYDTAIRLLQPIYTANPRATEVRRILRNTFRGRALAFDRQQKFVEAKKEWDEVVKLVRPEDPQYDLAARVYSMLFAKLVAEAVAEADTLTTRTSWEANEWLIFACAYSLASGVTPDKKTEHAERAVEMVRRAVKAGLKTTEALKADHFLDPIREREDFKQLLADLEKKSPKKEVPPPRADR